MELMNRKFVLLKIKQNGKEYTCKFDKGDNLLDSWLNLELVEPNPKKNKVFFKPLEFEPELFNDECYSSFEESYKNLNDYEELKELLSIKPLWLSVGNFDKGKYLVLSNLIACNQKNVISFDNFMLLCAAHCYLIADRKLTDDAAVVEKNASRSYHEAYYDLPKQKMPAMTLSKFYSNSIASKYGIPIDENIHWLIVPNFELLFHIYPSQVLVLAAHLSIESDYSEMFEQDFGTTSKIEANIAKSLQKYDDAIDFNLAEAAVCHQSVLVKHLPLKDKETKKPIEQNILEERLSYYLNSYLVQKPIVIEKSKLDATV